MTTLVEAGAGKYPSYDYIRRCKPKNIIFVAPESARFEYEAEFPGSVYYSIGFLEYVEQIATPASTDYLLFVNVLNGIPYEQLNILSVLDGARKVLRPGGVLRIEHTTDLAGINWGTHYNEECRNYGFNARLYMADRDTVKNHFVNPLLWHGRDNDGFSIEAILSG